MKFQDDSTTGASVTTGALARKLGISPTTLRSWDRRYGLGPATRISGRHRRWTVEDVAMVDEMCRLTADGIPPAEAARAAKAHAAGHAPRRAPYRPPAPAGKPFPGPAASPAGSAPGTAEARRRLRGLARAAARMNAEAVHEQVTDAIKSYGLVPSWEEVLSPALRAAGRKWKSSEDQYVEIEHFLSWHISTALRHAYADFTLQRRPADTRPALLACLPGEQHTLPLEALSAALAERGQRVLMLGSSVPIEAIEATVLRINPACVALWSQTRTTADVPLARHIAAVRWGINGARICSRVLLCGPGWGLRTEPELVRPHGLGDAVRAIGSASRLDADAVPSSEQSHQHSN